MLRAINLRIHDGEFMVLVGPSGCGKSTLLRMIAGLEDITGGTISVGDRVVNALPPKDRDIAMVFQSYALYPHMTVYDNLAFGLRRAANQDDRTTVGKSMDGKSDSKSRATLHPAIETFVVEFSRKLPKGWQYVTDREREIDRRVRLVAQSLQIEGLLTRLPKQLSGGQMQRVALGRAMARNPQVFLMDEPLSNLDAKLRAETRSEIVQLQRKLGTTTIYVTHDQTEAMTMGDRIAVLNNGQIQQLATPLELYNRPVNRFVAEFIGSPPMNFIPVQVKAPLLIQGLGNEPGNEFRMTLMEKYEPLLAGYDGQDVHLGVRPEHFSYGVPAPKNISIQVEMTEALGSETYIYGRLINSSETISNINIPIVARVSADRDIRVGEIVWLSIAPDKLHLFDPGTGLAIR
ncbi:MAG: ATP-binding cassette domain-containing protein [Alkalinema sp. CAN_BIN05]|nr:ATP-binding cassette domain-containing protein [Alkalinema sp. CAN_BIN05]